MSKILVIDDDDDIRFLVEDVGHIAKASVIEGVEYLLKLVEPTDICRVYLDIKGVGELHQMIDLCKKTQIEISLTTGGSEAAIAFGKAMAVVKNIMIYNKIDMLKMLEDA